MQNINERLSGVCPILPTPFCEDDTIDCGSLEREVNFLLDSGVSGIALFGNASEAFARSFLRIMWEGTRTFTII